MEEQENKNVACVPPIHTQHYGLPQDHTLLLTYDLYKPPLVTQKLLSEQGRRVFAESFIERIQLGPLSDLCVRFMAKYFGPGELLPMVENDPLQLRIHYDSLSVNLPLKACYKLTDTKYWRRVVLAMSTDKSLAYKRDDDYDWKSHAISMKLVEMVEACPAEYWPDDEIKALSLNIKEYIKEMTITKLQSLSERSFEQYITSDVEEESLGSIDSTLISSVSPTEASTIEEGEEEDMEEGEEEEKSDGVPQEKTPLQIEAEELEAEFKAARRADQLQRHEQKRRAIEAQMDRRRRREEIRQAESGPPVKPKKKKAIKIKSVFDIEISEGEEDIDMMKSDKRNMEKYLHRLKKYNYPEEHCHHIDLGFLRYFDNLVSFSIEFQGPDMQRNYHSRHFNFSYKDMENLAYGVSYLYQLKIFRLRNSRMNAKKLDIILRSLRNLLQLEVMDFGNDQLGDDCGKSLYYFFHHTVSVKSLELEGNFLSVDVLRYLGEALVDYVGRLEYLGLALNPLNDEALHELVRHVVDTPQLSNLDLTATYITPAGIVCCIANELLRNHKALKQLKLRAVYIGWLGGMEIMKALHENYNLIEFDCRDCDLDFDIERDIKVVLHRNHYVLENPYINDETKTQEDIDEIVNRTKNRVLIETLADLEKRVECLDVRPEDPRRHTLIQIDEDLDLDTIGPGTIVEESFSADTSSSEFSGLEEWTRKRGFVYSPNDFDEEEFIKHVYVPGPNERYYYFRQLLKYSQSNVYDKSLVEL